MKPPTDNPLRHTIKTIHGCDTYFIYRKADVAVNAKTKPNSDTHYVVALHGWLSSSFEFRHLGHQHNNHFLAPDLPGCGNSQKQTAWPLNQKHLAEWLYRFLRVNIPDNAPIHIIAEDFSCWMVLELLRSWIEYCPDAAQRKPLKISQITLINPSERYNGPPLPTIKLGIIKPLSKSVRQYLSRKLPHRYEPQVKNTYLAPFDNVKTLKALAELIKHYAKDSDQRKKVMRTIGNQSNTPVIQIYNGSRRKTSECQDTYDFASKLPNVHILPLKTASYFVGETHADRLKAH